MKLDLSDFEVKDGVLLKNGNQGRLRKDGYIDFKVGSKSYLAHRLVFYIYNGYFPKYVDHINGEKSDNRIENLRECTKSQNQMNRKRNKNSKHPKGIHFVKSTKKYRVRIQADKVRHLIGDYDNIEDAKLAINKARAIMHKEFYNKG